MHKAFLDLEYKGHKIKLSDKPIKGGLSFSYGKKDLEMPSNLVELDEKLGGLRIEEAVLVRDLYVQYIDANKANGVKESPMKVKGRAFEDAKAKILETYSEEDYKNAHGLSQLPPKVERTTPKKPSTSATKAKKPTTPKVEVPKSVKESFDQGEPIVANTDPDLEMEPDMPEDGVLVSIPEESDDSDLDGVFNKSSESEGNNSEATNGSDGIGTIEIDDDIFK